MVDLVIIDLLIKLKAVDAMATSPPSILYFWLKIYSLARLFLGKTVTYYVCQLFFPKLEWIAFFFFFPNTIDIFLFYTMGRKGDPTGPRGRLGGIKLSPI